MFLYLTDVTKTSGATYYPQTYREIRHHIFSILSNCSDIHQLKNFISELNISSKVDIECRKGTLMICDTVICTVEGIFLKTISQERSLGGYFLFTRVVYLSQQGCSGISEKNFKDFLIEKH